MSLIRENLKEKWRGLVFRRVKRVIPRVSTTKYHLIHTGAGKRDTIRVNARYSIAPYGKEYSNRYITSHYGSYYGFTRKETIDSPFGDTSLDGKEIYFNKRDYNCLDLSNDMTFSMSTKAQDFHKSDILPLEGALVCGFVASDDEAHLRYTKWWVCSDQFLWLWLLIMYDDHQCFKPSIQDRIDRLVTNSFLLWCVEHPDSSEEEKRLKFIYNRAEPCSYYSYLYKCIAMCVLDIKFDIRDYEKYVPYGTKFVEKLESTLVPKTEERTLWGDE